MHDKRVIYDKIVIMLLSNWSDGQDKIYIVNFTKY